MQNHGHDATLGEEHPLTPPQAPPLPPPLVQPSHLSLKVKVAPPGRYIDTVVAAPPRENLAPPIGPYFLYGTLQDPSMLVDILDLPVAPTLRRAEVIGYEKKLWGQYPALIAKPGAVVQGLVFDVGTIVHGAKLAAYETDNYRAEPCTIRYIDGEGPEQVSGYSFLFVGSVKDLTEGQFDLDVWLRRMRRKAR